MNTRKNHRWLLSVISLLLLSALACSLTGTATPTETPTESPTEEVTVTDAPTEEAVPTSTNTPAPDVSGPGGCTLNASWVADVTVPDNTEFAPGATFNKVWRVRNSGTCTWEAGTQLVFVSGEPLGGPTAVAVPAVAPGSNTDIGVDLIAPAAPETYRSTWQLQAPDGVRFGSQIYVQIVVPEAATEEPTAEPTATPTEEAAAPPDLIITDLKVDTSDPRQGIPLHIVATLRNQGDSPAENFHWAWRVCVHAGCTFTEAPGAFTLGPGEEVVVQMEYLFNGWSTYTTEAWADSREEITESDEANNTRQLVIPVQAGRPDLIISEIKFTPYPPVQGENTTVEVSIHNQGSNNTPGAFAIEWWGGVNFPTPSCEWTMLGSIAKGDTATVHCTYVYGSWYGNITTRAIADVNDATIELDETNNSMDRVISVAKP